MYSLSRIPGVLSAYYARPHAVAYMTRAYQLYEEVIAHLRNDHASLRATALTCHSLLAVSQRRLFARVVLYPSLTADTSNSSLSGARPTSSKFKQILSHSPHISRYVEQLELHLCPERIQWAGWTSSLDFCLENLQALCSVSLKVDQSPFRANGYMVSAPEDYEGTVRIKRALCNTLQLPTLTCVEAYRFDISTLLSQCRYMKELTLSKPILRLGTIDLLLYSRGPADGPIFLESLRLMTAFEENDSDSMLRGILLKQGISLARLKTLSRVAWGFVDAVFMYGLWHILEECHETLETLEIQTHFTAFDLYSLDWSKFKLPALRVLHLHLYSHDSTISRDDLQSFITALLDLSFPPDIRDHPNSTHAPSGLECLILTQHNVHWDHLHIGNFLVKILSDRLRFPVFRKLTWDACAATAQNLYDHMFSEANGVFPFKVDVGPGVQWSEIGKPLDRA